MVRFVGTKPAPNFETRTGLLGVQRDPKPGAVGILKATKNIIKGFSRIGAEKKHSKDMFKHIATSIKFMTVDAAADETLAVELGKIKSTKIKALRMKLTPRLAHLERDKMHGGRRVLSRPWSKDVRAKTVIGKLVRSKKCPAGLLHNSRQLRMQYKHVLEKSGKVKLLGHCKYAKHRVEPWRSRARASGLSDHLLG